MSNLNNPSRQEQVMSQECLGSSLIQINSSLPSSLQSLDLVQYHHQNTQYQNSIPSDPFAVAAFENSMMYLPEVGTSNGQHDDRQPRQDQQEEMYEDIVANTNPVLRNFDLDIIHNNSVFDAKRRLHQTNMARSMMIDDGYKNHHSECQSLLDLMYEKADEDLESEIFEEDDDLYDFMRLKPKPGKFLSEYNDEDKISDMDIFEAPPRFDVEYEDCRDANRSHCGGDHPDDKDNGLDSTMSFSIKDDVHSRRNHKALGALSHRKVALSQFDGDQDIDDKDFEMLMEADEGKFLQLNRQKSLKVGLSDSKKGFYARKQSEVQQSRFGTLLTPCAPKKMGQNLLQKLIGDKTPMLDDPEIKNTPSTMNENMYQYFMSNNNDVSNFEAPHTSLLSNLSNNFQIQQCSMNKYNKQQEIQITDKKKPEILKPKNLAIKKTKQAAAAAPEGNKKSQVKPKKAKDMKVVGEITFENNVLNSQTTSTGEETEVVVEKKLTKISAANAKAEKYYKQFDFFFNRSCFRIMTEFFKDKFNRFYAEKQVALKKLDFQLWQKNLKEGGLTATSKADMNIMMKDFIDYILGKDILKEQSITPHQRQQIIHSMMMICFSHRYNKGDKFIQEAEQEAEANIDFTIVRDVMYKYSKKAQDRYFSYPIEAFLFAAFSLSDEGINFLQNKPDNQADPEKLRRLRADLAELKNQAVSSLQGQLYSAENPVQTNQSPELGLYLYNELKRMTRGKI